MRDARFTIPTPGLLTKVVDLLADLPMDQRDTTDDVYEYMLAKIATSGQNGPFRNPRHIIQLMLEMVAPTPTDTIRDPACGTAGFLVSAGEYLVVGAGDPVGGGPRLLRVDRGRGQAGTAALAASARPGPMVESGPGRPAGCRGTW